MNLRKPIDVFSLDVTANPERKSAEIMTKQDMRASEASSSNSKNGEGTLYVGEGIEYSGSILKAQAVIIRGKAEGEIKTDRLEIEEPGSFKGNVEARDVTVAGSLEGEIKASRGLTVRTSGRVQGDLKYQTLSVEEGGVVSGSLTQDAPKVADLPTHKKDLDVQKGASALTQ